MKLLPALVACLSLAACATTETTPASPPDNFMTSLKTMCGRTFSGRLVTTDPADRDFAGKPLEMGPVACTDSEVSIPFAVGENRSRTWVITRTAAGLRLKHVHRHDDGHEDKVSRYGGDTISPGTDRRQEFPADAFSKDLFRSNGLERSLTNIWAIEVVPEQLFAYELRRADRFFRVEFKLNRQQ